MYNLFLPPPAPRDRNPRSHPRREDNDLASSGAGSALFLPAGFSHQFFGLLEGGRAALTTMYTSTSSLSPSPPPQTLPFSTFLPHAKSSRLPPAWPPPMEGASFSPNSNYKKLLSLPCYSPLQLLLFFPPQTLCNVPTKTFPTPPVQRSSLSGVQSSAQR